VKWISSQLEFELTLAVTWAGVGWLGDAIPQAEIPSETINTIDITWLCADNVVLIHFPFCLRLQ
jgi:hypothetical protein